jgi:peptidoglycan/LPS O-acetylase OafA/YrhL
MKLPVITDRALLPKTQFSARIPELDGVRGLAIALVLVWHYVGGQVQTTPGTFAAYFLKLFSLTWAGVDVFFVLSGFLIGGILLDQRTAPNYFRAFYVRRFCRIFPLYYLMFALFVLGIKADLPRFGGGFAWLFSKALPLWTYAIYWQNGAMALTGEMDAHWFAITWSLAVEEQFYIVLPILVRFTPLKFLPWILGMLIASAPILRALMFCFSAHGGLAGYVLLPARWDALFLGVLGAWALRNENYARWLQARLRWISAVVFLCGIILCGLLLTNQGIASPGMNFGGHTVLAVMSLGLILLALQPRMGLVRKVFLNKQLIWLGTVSYGVYLFHQPIAGLLHGLLLQQRPRISNFMDGLITLFALATTLGGAVLSWRFFELPLVRYGQQTRYEGKPISNTDEYDFPNILAATETKK